MKEIKKHKHMKEIKKQKHVKEIEKQKQLMKTVWNGFNLLFLFSFSFTVVVN